MNAEPRIVLIDDDTGWGDTLADYLRSKGFPVQIARAGREGLSLLERVRPPLAIIDLHLPDMNGWELLHQLRGRHPELQVLMLSGSDEPELARRATAAGARAFVPKSAVPNMLLGAVRQALLDTENRDGAARRRGSFLPVPRPAGRTLPALVAPEPSQVA